MRRRKWVFIVLHPWLAYRFWQVRRQSWREIQREQTGRMTLLTELFEQQDAD